MRVCQTLSVLNNLLAIEISESGESESEESSFSTLGEGEPAAAPPPGNTSPGLTVNFAEFSLEDINDSCPSTVLAMDKAEPGV